MESHSGSRNIWLFSEERSGSSWLSRELARRFSKQHVGVDEFEEHQEWVHHTHEFEYLEKITNPIVIRTTRKDQFQHFLSYSLFTYGKANGWRHPHISFPKSVDGFNQFLTLPKLSITEADIEYWTDLKNIRNSLWDAYQGEKQTVYYEDLYEGVAIPALRITKIGFSDGGEFKKLPYIKEDHIANIHDVKAWFDKYAYQNKDVQ
jgi:hypothetical protein